eukprot:5307640-Pyramimonas_sp.AAC.1
MPYYAAGCGGTHRRPDLGVGAPRKAALEVTLKLELKLELKLGDVTGETAGRILGEPPGAGLTARPFKLTE